MIRRFVKAIVVIVSVAGFSLIPASPGEAKGSHGGGVHVSGGVHISAGGHSFAHGSSVHVAHVGGNFTSARQHSSPHVGSFAGVPHSVTHSSPTIIHNQVHSWNNGIARSSNNWNHSNWNHNNWYYPNWNYGSGWGYPFWAGLYLGGLGGYYPDYGYAYDSGDYYVPAYTSIPTEPAQQLADQNTYLDESRAAFRAGNYQEALRLAGHATVDAPQDASAHELASLSLFALGNYRGAAVEAHAVAALGTPSNWQQLAGNYDDVQTYANQLRTLEKYVADNDSSADGHFVLGMQYLMTGYNSAAATQFTKVALLTPNDQIAVDLLKKLQA